MYGCFESLDAGSGGALFLRRGAVTLPLIERLAVGVDCLDSTASFCFPATDAHLQLVSSNPRGALGMGLV